MGPVGIKCRELGDALPSEYNGHPLFDGEEVTESYADPTAADWAVVLNTHDICAELLEVTAGIKLGVFW